MTKTTFLPALLIAAAALTCCGEVASPAPTCRDILEHGGVLYDAESAQEMTLSEYMEAYEVSADRYAELDLDGDSAPETVLWLSRAANEYYGFLILHSAPDAVHAYTLAYRQFSELKADGTFIYSAGVSDFGVGRMTFADGAHGAYLVTSLAYSASDEAQNVSRYIGGDVVPQADFDAYMAAQGAKPDAPWQDFTPAPPA